MIVIEPKEWKQRSLSGVPLSDMPLRTIKVLIQHIYGQSAGVLDDAFQLKGVLLTGVLGERGTILALRQEFGENFLKIKVNKPYLPGPHLAKFLPAAASAVHLRIPLM